ncbi:TMEM175 family protein [Gordonia defluvii]|jgi:uncharacterized membrane protein|uniref:TMEM175 family protein n=1 Tax=Gordonia defluvii TaxID=283718 RepID=A0ABP6LDU3_9ACTN|nr:TMEM175 family protein [Gordonia sp. UBA5067]
MPNDPQRRTTEGLRRLIMFSDAVVAIAMTLLVLPVADVAGKLQVQRTFLQAVGEHRNELMGFIVSFTVIWVLWRNHHQIMENYRNYNSTMFNVHFAWLLSIVVLPLATALISNDQVPWADAFYLVVLAVAIGSLITIARQGARHRDLLVDDDDVRAGLAGWSGVGTLLALVVALVITLVWPSVGSLPLLLLLIPGPVNALVTRVRGG